MLNATGQKPTEQLLIGRRALEELRNVKLLEDWKWCEAIQQWVLFCRLNLEVEQGSEIPTHSDWYVLVEATYPWGSIVFYPSQQGGITQTFPHQNYNGDPHKGLPWRTGRLCVDTNLHILGRKTYDTNEPFDAYFRLKWHFIRVLEWLTDASKHDLVHKGDPYELPFFPIEGSTMVAFSEGSESYKLWGGIHEKVGLALISNVPRKQNFFYVRGFYSIRNEILLESSWGRMFRDVKGGVIRAGWIKLEQIPVISPWQAPVTWGELREACYVQGVNLDDQLQRIAFLLRDGKEHLLFLGSSIPKRVGGPDLQFQWLALTLPCLTTALPNGFRPIEKNRWAKDRTHILKDQVNLIWHRTENWNSRELEGRGVFSSVMTKQTIALIGVGALGSIVAEQLVRGGVYHLMVVDGDVFEAGNAVRHTLTLESIGVNKAQAIAMRLNSVSPHAEVIAISVPFPPGNEVDTKKLGIANVIIDCTGTDDVLQKMSTFNWCDKKIFISIC